MLGANTDRALADASTRVIYADLTKFGKIAPIIVMPVSQVLTSVTGSELVAEFVEGLHSRSSQVALA